MIARQFIRRHVVSRNLVPIRCITSPRLIKFQLLIATGTTPFARRGLHTSTSRLSDDDSLRIFQGRFLRNEEDEMSQHVKFDEQELVRIATEASDSKSCVKVSEYTATPTKRLLHLAMDDGSYVVAKIYTPKAGRPHYVTASEVATMEFARDALKIPVPKVYAWSSKAQENSVGAEYIITEGVTGIRLDMIWEHMDLDDRIEVVKSIARHQQALMSMTFRQFGSLYYAQDLDAHSPGPLYTDSAGVPIENPKYAVGPSTEREEDGRATYEFDRGPWNTLEEYLSALGHREMSCIKSVPQLPKSKLTLNGPGSYQPTREKKLKALQYYLTLLKYLLPTDKTLHSSQLWYDNLVTDNIFVDIYDAGKVVAIIDWQSVGIAPLFHCCHQPFFMGPIGPPLLGLEQATMPENFAALDPAEQESAKENYSNTFLSRLYRDLLYMPHPHLRSTLEFQETPGFDLLLFARLLLAHDEAKFFLEILKLERNWDKLPGVRALGGAQFPLRISKEEREEIKTDAAGSEVGMVMMKAVAQAMDELFPNNQDMTKERYEKAKARLRIIKKGFINGASKNEAERAVWEENWPFDD